MEGKKVIYIAGPITGVENYREIFAQTEKDLEAIGYIPLNPANLPQGMSDDQYMRIDMAMLDSADAVLFLLNWEDSNGATLEHARAQCTNKPCIYQKRPIFGTKWTDDVERRDWLTMDLMEVIG